MEFKQSFLNVETEIDLSPRVDSTAEIHDSLLGDWTAVGARTVIVESELGHYSYIGPDSLVNYSTIGRFCSIAAHTCINPGNHPLSKAALHHFTYRSRYYQMAKDDDHAFFDWRRQQRVTLEHDVWIGHGATVLPGVCIGTGAAVGAGAVVSKNVPPFAIVAGVPAKIIRLRFDEATAQGLMRISWWNWTHAELAGAVDDFRYLSAEQFVQKYDPLGRGRPIYAC